MYIETVPNGNSPPAILLREAWREDGKIKKRTIANLTHWPAEKIEALRRVLKNEPQVDPAETFVIDRSTPHGHVRAVLGTIKRLGLFRSASERSKTSRPARRCPERFSKIGEVSQGHHSGRLSLGGAAVQAWP